VAIPKEKRPVTKHWNLIGLAIFLFYFGSLIYYIIIRATKTLNMGYLGCAGGAGGCGAAAGGGPRGSGGGGGGSSMRAGGSRRRQAAGPGPQPHPTHPPTHPPTPPTPPTPRYGLLVLLIEIISSTATIGYAVLLIKYSKSRRTKGLPIAKKGQQPDLDNLMFHVRVLIPCYKESTELVKTTVLGAVKAPLPRNTLRTVYLCDDGKVRAAGGGAGRRVEAAATGSWAAAGCGRGEGTRAAARRRQLPAAASHAAPSPLPPPLPPPQDPSKEAMIRDLNAEYGCLEYVAGRKRDPNGETNGKSNNLNHCLKNVIYKDYSPVNPNGPKIPKHEVMVVFDADMVAKPNFFTKVRRAPRWQSGLAMAVWGSPAGVWGGALAWRAALAAGGQRWRPWQRPCQPPCTLTPAPSPLPTHPTSPTPQPHHTRPQILEVMLDDDCALCLTPQGFNNVDAQSDIFNNLNLSFWEYMLPGTDALGYIACTGTNFCIRCAPLADCGFFPTWTITEDYALGMILKAKVRQARGGAAGAGGQAGGGRAGAGPRRRRRPGRRGRGGSSRAQRSPPLPSAPAPHPPPPPAALQGRLP
jgi:cellulose synthase/poly-beta-1,6-N-acetylglucosamine synthase-like glycosyltransferase